MIRQLAKLSAPIILVIALLTSAGASTAASPDRHTTLTWDQNSLREVYQPANRFYSYAPSVVRDGDTTWIWTCHNDQANVIRDHVYLTKIENGRVVEDRSVLQGSAAPAWDSFHTCDPSVVKGDFRFAGERYGYAMFYLGNDVDASAHNQVGVAFATSPEGPWTKDPRPVVTFDRVDQWGVGQPSAVTIGRGSQVLLFYTRGDTSTRAYVSKVDLGGHGVVVSPPTLITTTGLTGTDGGADWLNGYDVAYDAARHSFHVVREQHPYPNDNPWWIGPSVQVDRIDATDLLHGSGRWQVEGNVDKTLTGLDRNHNAGLVRDWYGNLKAEDSLGVVFTSSCSSLPTVDDQDWSQATCDSLYSYHLWEIDGVLQSG